MDKEYIFDHVSALSDDEIAQAVYDKTVTLTELRLNTHGKFSSMDRIRVEERMQEMEAEGLFTTSDPVPSDPTDEAADSTGADSASQPVVQQPVIPQPVLGQTVIGQPVILQPVVPQPVIPQPVVPQPVIPQPVVPQPVQPQPAAPAGTPYGENMQREEAMRLFRAPFYFNGRIRRLEYGLSLLLGVALFVGLWLLFSALCEEFYFDVPIIVAIGVLACMPVLWFCMAQAAKRCHDVGNSGWYQVIPLYPLILLFLEGEYDVNQYGYPAK